MSLERSGRQEKKLRAFLDAQLRLKHRFERIDYLEDVTQPMVEKLKSGKVVLLLEEGDAFDMQVRLAVENNENQTGSNTTSPDTTGSLDESGDSLRAPGDRGDHT
jgi:hypothetical protein